MAVNVIYYSMYGHIKALVDATVVGLKATGVKVNVFRVAETLSDEILTKMHAKEQAHNAGIPVIDPTSNWPADADGFVFGIPTRFGMMSAQMKTFWDGTGGHWSKGSLQNKFAGVLTSTATQAGGQETTALTTVTQFTHHGMCFVAAGYCYPALQFDNDVVHGGSPYGPGTLAGPTGARKPSDGELAFAEAYGRKMGAIVSAYAAGKAAQAGAAH